MIEVSEHWPKRESMARCGVFAREGDEVVGAAWIGSDLTRRLYTYNYDKRFRHCGNGYQGPEEFDKYSHHAWNRMITAVAVHPSLRGMGIGKLIMIETLLMADSLNYPNVGLETEPFNDYARRFYAGLGFVQREQAGTRRFFHEFEFTGVAVSNLKALQEQYKSIVSNAVYEIDWNIKWDNGMWATDTHAMDILQYPCYKT